MGNSNLHLSLIAAAGMVLGTVAALMVWRQQTKLSYRSFLLGDVLRAPAAVTEFATSARLGELVVSRFALVSRQILDRCGPHFIGQTPNNSLNRGRDRNWFVLQPFKQT